MDRANEFEAEVALELKSSPRAGRARQTKDEIRRAIRIECQQVTLNPLVDNYNTTAQ